MRMAPSCMKCRSEWVKNSSVNGRYVLMMSSRRPMRCSKRSNAAIRSRCLTTVGLTHAPKYAPATGGATGPPSSPVPVAIDDGVPSSVGTAAVGGEPLHPAAERHTDSATRTRIAFTVTLTPRGRGRARPRTSRPWRWRGRPGGGRGGGRRGGGGGPAAGARAPEGAGRAARARGGPPPGGPVDAPGRRAQPAAGVRAGRAEREAPPRHHGEPVPVQQRLDLLVG